MCIRILINSTLLNILGWKSKHSIPSLVFKYLDKKLMLDEFISHRLPFVSINKGFELLHSGERLVIKECIYIYNF